VIEGRNLPNVHIAIMQPVGYVHSLGLVDPARFVRHQLRRLGAEVTMAKNRLRADALNIVFGAHLGFPPEWRERHACLFVNLEQLGMGGAEVSPSYLKLLKTSGVIDYDTANVSAYVADPADVPIIPFTHARYLEDRSGDLLPLQDRPIDLLFFGSMNERRRRFIERVESAGATVAMFDKPLYLNERDNYVRQAKAVLNCHFYDCAKFEQVRAFHCLSLGTPVIAERGHGTSVPSAFEDSVIWVNEDELDRYFSQEFRSPTFYHDADRRLQNWRDHDSLDSYEDLLSFVIGYMAGHARHKPSDAWRPSRINLGSGKDYQPGWLNLDILDRTEPDLVLDLAQPHRLPLSATTRYGSEVILEEGSVDVVNANNVLEHVPDLPRLMTNVLALLKEGGRLEVEVPYEKALTAWQDPTHIRAMNENSWTYYTDWFWYLGWIDHRFEIKASQWLDAGLRPCEKGSAAFMRLSLEKVRTSPAERVIALTMRPTLDLPDDDEVDEASHRSPSCAALMAEQS
jgi:SAM-dependent methyltransferase